MRGSIAKSNLLPLGGLVAVLLLFFLWPWVQHGFRFPLGPDTPVYLWWARLGGHDGLSAVGGRPGIPALLLVATGTLHVPLVAVTAGLEITLGVGVGLGAAALVRGRFGPAERAEWIVARQSPERDRPEWLLAGLLCGMFAVHLVAGYMANLAFAVAFLAAVAALTTGTRRGAIAAAVLLGGGGLSHPQFFVLGVAILVLAATPSFLQDRGSRTWRETEFGRVGIAVLGGAALLGAGLLSMLYGPKPPDVDTSKDALLRRLDLSGDLRAAYWDRFLDRSARYVHWLSIPLAIFGLPAARGFVGRALRSWGVATIAGVAVALATAWFPADRFVTFGYVVPILAALGLVRLARALSARRAVAAVVCAAFGIAMVLGAAFAWRRQEPFMTSNEVRSVTEASVYAATIDEPGPTAFVVYGKGEAGAFELARAGNVIRASVPPDRVRSTVVVAPCTNSGSGSAAPSGSLPDSIGALSCRTLEETRGSHEGLLVFELKPFSGPDEQAFEPSGVEVAPGVRLVEPAGPDAAGSAAAAPATPASSGARARGSIEGLGGTSPAGIALAAIAVLALLGAAGYGWARAWLGAGVSSVALAPAFGLAVITLAGILTDRVGIRLAGSAGPTIVAALSGGGGYLAWFVLQRRTASQAAPEVGKQPQE